tara:strand:+ start:1277 stop:1660 length:384 start_codon:yes stop_codon:yes gene_type:complete
MVFSFLRSLLGSSTPAPASLPGMVRSVEPVENGYRFVVSLVAYDVEMICGGAVPKGLVGAEANYSQSVNGPYSVQRLNVSGYPTLRARTEVPAITEGSARVFPLERDDVSGSRAKPYPWAWDAAMVA